jgi:hypothetical protein
MPDWNNADGMQLALVQEAVLHAFPSPPDLEMLLQFRLNKSYAQLVAGSANYRYAIFQILIAARSEYWLGDLIKAARTQNPGNPRLRALRPLADLAQASGPAGRQLEDIVRTDGGFQDVIPWLRRLDKLRSQICRIENPVNQAVGTGWLVDRDLLLTNWHVVRRVLKGEKKASDVTLRFDYAEDADGTNPGVTFKLAAEWCLQSSPASAIELGEGDDEPTMAQLDYALLRVAQPAGDMPGPVGERRGWVQTKRGTPAAAFGEIVFVLQHPQGDPLKLAIGASKGSNSAGSRLMHDANTLRGSSGSPCLNARLELVALHNAGDPLYDGVIGSPQQNQAVPVEWILADIEGAGGPTFWSN